MSRRFDTVVAVDWSSAGKPAPAKQSPNAIWIVVAGAEPRYFRTRAATLDWLAAFLAAERAAGRRVLAGFDFPFGYPRGFAVAATGRPAALAIWELLARRIEDRPDNANKRFAAAAALNAALPGTGPFWGRPGELDLPALPATTRGRSHPFPDRRLVETRAPRARTCWQLHGAGSVGGQMLTGLPALWRLRSSLKVAVWPFDTGLGVPDAPVVLAEIYPSLLAAEIGVDRREREVLDAAQVRVTARALAGLDAAGGLDPLFAAPPDLTAAERTIVGREEGWILGVGHEAALRDAARPPPTGERFALPPGVDWVPVDTALARLRDRMAPLGGRETVPVAEAGGRILAARLTALRSHPPAANAAVDGFGFAHAALDPATPTLRLVAGRAAAGAPYPGALPHGSAVRILTGALLPDGVDTVALNEIATVASDGVTIAGRIRPGVNTRAAGEDKAAGATLLEVGSILGPAEIALAAITGAATVEVRPRLRVAVLSTGDEIVSAGEPAAPHQTFDANRPMLLDVLRRWGMDPVDLGRAADSAEALAAALDAGAGRADAIITSGGASAGDEDHVARLLKASGGLETWRIAVKPGRPLALGAWRGVPTFGLPGNPVAAFVCALIFVRPALLRLAGAPWLAPQGLLVPARFEKAKHAGRREYLRARLDSGGGAEVFASEGSGRVSGLAWARGLVELDDGARRIKPGDPVRYLPFAEFGL